MAKIKRHKAEMTPPFGYGGVISVCMFREGENHIKHLCSLQGYNNKRLCQRFEQQVNKL